MHDSASHPSQLQDAAAKVTKGAIHFLNRVMPLIFEDKDFFMKAMWHEQPLYQNQVNATSMMDATCILFFKPGFTVLQFKD